MLKSLKELEEEEPQLHIMWDEQLGEIHAMLMGEVQIEILKHLIWERFHVAVEFGTGNIVYKETIAAPVEAWDILNRFVIMQRCIFFWNREREEADCSFLLRQMKISWIGTGSG